MNKNIASTANQTTSCAVDTTVGIVNGIYARIAEKHFYGKTASQNIHDALPCSGIGSLMALPYDC